MNRPSIFIGFCILFTLAVTSGSAEERLPWTTSRVIGSPEPPKPYQVQRVYPQLQFKNPVELVAMTGQNQMLMLQVDGKLSVFDDDQECRTADLILDLATGPEPMRAFGFGLHPHFQQNRQLFVVYSSDTRNVDGAARLSRFIVPRQAPYLIDRDSEEVLLTWTSGGHNGSTIDFDKQGMLYFSAGDGARPFPPDEFNVGQNLSDLRATICRIDVDHADGDRPYRIPPDNPFVDVPGARGEIWAYGFRNPWRFTIDEPTGRLLCGDVGWEMWESVFDVKRGGNYGWSIFEGPGALRGDVVQGPTAIVKPLAAYSHSLGQSITGGVVYRGRELPELEGTYLYGDYVSGLLWGLQSDGGEVIANPVLANTGMPIITFAASASGDVLVVSYEGGIYKLVRNPLVDQPSQFPTRLSETGLFDSLGDLTPSAGVYRYGLAAESVHPSATKQYHVAVPDHQTIKVGRQKRQWKYPIGTVFVRTFSWNPGPFNSRRIKVETQLLHYDGLSWQPYRYLWDESQREAHLLAADTQTHSLEPLGLKSVDWSVHSQAQCRSCHTNQAGGAVGFSLENLSDSAIKRFVEIGVLDQPAPQGWKIRKMVPPSKWDADLDARARSYLAANCAHCHRRGGGGSVALDLEYSHPNDSIGAIDVPPMQGNFEMNDARVIAPGDPYRSVMLYRMASCGIGRMPKLSNHDPDPTGIRLIHDWINSMPPGVTLERRSLPSRTSAALERLIAALEADNPELSTAMARQEMKDGNVLVEALFEHFLPASERRKQLGPNIDADQILAMSGDAHRGRKWLTETRGAQCIACHRVEGQGQNVGPSFDAIGSKRTAKELLESIINPSAKVDAKYQSHSVLTAEGAVITGLKIVDDATHLTIRSADGKDHVVDKGSIEAQRIQPQSLMPSGQAESMTARELADLLAFLQSLR